jgi:hypothetical protein
LWSTIPNRASTFVLTTFGSGAPEEEMTRRDGKRSDCNPFQSAYSSRREYIAGVPSRILTGSFFKRSRMAGGSKCGVKKTVPPTIKVPSKTTDRPTEWDIGNTPSKASWEVTERIRADTAAMKSRFRWESITPLGTPVVPEV